MPIVSNTVLFLSSFLRQKMLNMHENFSSRCIGKCTQPFSLLSRERRMTEERGARSLISIACLRGRPMGKHQSHDMTIFVSTLSTGFAGRKKVHRAPSISSMRLPTRKSLVIGISLYNYRQHFAHKNSLPNSTNRMPNLVFIIRRSLTRGEYLSIGQKINRH